MQRNDILRKIEVVENYKKRIFEYLDELNRLYNYNHIDKKTYNSKVNELIDGRTPLEWIYHYDNLLNEYKQQLYTGYAYPEEDKKINIRLILSLFILFGVIMYIFFKPSITGFYTGVPVQTFEDGYKIEGQKWIDIKGMKFYERCLKVKSDIEFNQVDIIGKITSAAEKNDISLRLYNNDAANNQPGLELGSCRVDNYEDIWKTCSIESDNQKNGDYWICASYPDGEYGRTYYTIAYQNGDIGRTAFWTGQNWQKLDRNSYTLKAVFKKYG